MSSSLFTTFKQKTSNLVTKSVNLSFNNQDTFEKLAGRISSQIEADSISLLNVFNETAFLNESGFDINTALGMYIPNSYEFYWNTSAKLFRSKMLDEYNRFWNESRIQKTKKLNLSKKCKKKSRKFSLSKLMGLQCLRKHMRKLCVLSWGFLHCSSTWLLC